MVFEFAQALLKMLKPFPPPLRTEHLYLGEKDQQNFVHKRSQQRDSQEPRGGTNPSVPQHMRGCAERGPHTAARVSLETTVLGERGQTGRVTDWMLPFI